MMLFFSSVQKQYNILLLSAKIIQTIIYVSAVSINRRYGYIFEKVSPVSQKETVREAFLLPPQLF